MKTRDVAGFFMVLGKSCESVQEHSRTMFIRCYLGDLGTNP